MIYATSQQATVIGAGIAGLVVALFLKRAGFSPVVFEEREGHQEAGEALLIAPNGMHVLHELGLSDEVMERGSVIEQNTFMNSRGKILATYGNGNNPGMPSICISRQALIIVLTNAVNANGIPVRYGKRLKNITGSYGQRGVCAWFEDDSMERSDILIGADGINSTTRRIAFPESPAPAYTGVVSIGGFTDASLVKNVAGQKVSVTSMGGDGYFSYSMTGCGENNSIGWWVNLSRKDMTPHEFADVSIEQVKLQLLKIYKGWHEPVESIIANASNVSTHSIFDLVDMTSWYGGRVVLIGDAAHAMIPHAGQGAATAMEDAMYLAKLLRYNKTSSLVRIFEEYQHHRKARVHKIVRLARRYGKPERITSGVGLAVRDLFMSSFMHLFRNHINDWMYAYKIDWNSSR